MLARAYATLAGGQTAPAYLALVPVPLGAYVLRRTRFGLRLRACGEHPAAVDAAGVPVARLRHAAVVIASALCGVAGAAISTAQGTLPRRGRASCGDMTSGHGYTALAAMTLGGWRPWPILLARFGFGLLDAAAIRLQGAALPGIGAFPVQAVQALPYLLAVVLLAGFVGRATPPKAAGQPYTEER